MPKPLLITDYVDENLKLVRDGDGTDTALELSKDKLKINGNLDVTGTIESSTIHAGQILGFTAIGIDSADDSYATTTSYVVTDADHKVTFIVPPSGNVEILASIFADSGNTRGLFLGLSTASSYSRLEDIYEHEVLTADETDEQMINHKWVITGLIAGTQTTYWLGAKGQQAGVVVLRWGGNAADEYAPFIMKATALPIGIYTG